MIEVSYIYVYCASGTCSVKLTRSDRGVGMQAEKLPFDLLGCREESEVGFEGAVKGN